MKIINKKLFMTAIAIAIFTIFLDQINKWYMIEIFDIRSKSPVEVTPFFDLVMVWNRGISFGLFQSEYSIYIFTVLSTSIVLVLLFWLKNNEKKLVALALGFMIGGALGNVIDRLHYEAVADFFYFHIGDNYFPAFNIADSAVFIGACMLIIDSLFFDKDENKNKKDENKGNNNESNLKD